MEQHRAGIRGMTGPDLRALLTRASAVLLDFDGPICSVFAGYPAPQIAAELRALLEARGVPLPDKVRSEPDPMEVLRWVPSLGDARLVHEIERALCHAEFLATQTATPTPHAPKVVSAAIAAGKMVAIVSNNSAASINAYLDRNGLTEHIAFVAGRAYGEPERMKPDPEPIRRAATALNVRTHACVLIGDSLFDIEAAKAAGSPVVAYANKPTKLRRFTDARADAIVTSMADVAAALEG
jgi:HAD superfamily hydrolase (TIGR01509 family)